MISQTNQNAHKKIEKKFKTQLKQRFDKQPTTKVLKTSKRIHTKWDICKVHKYIKFKHITSKN